MVTKISTMEVNPLDGGATDFYSRWDEDEHAIVTFHTITDSLKDAYEISLRNNTEDLAGYRPLHSIDKEVFDNKDAIVEHLKMPGVYDDKPEDSDSRCYTIVVPESIFTIELMEHWISVLNHEFNEELRLYNRCATCKSKTRLTEAYRPDSYADHEKWKRNRIFCSQECFRQHRGTKPGLEGKGKREEERKEKRRKERGMMTLKEFRQSLEEDKEEVNIWDVADTITPEEQEKLRESEEKMKEGYEDMTRQAEEDEQGCMAELEDGERCGTIARENLYKEDAEDEFWVCERHFTQHINNSLGKPVNKAEEDNAEESSN